MLDIVINTDSFMVTGMNGDKYIDVLMRVLDVCVNTVSKLHYISIFYLV